MSKNKTFLIITLFSILIFQSCNYLDIVPAEIETEDKIYSDIKTAEEDLGAMYNLLTWNYDAGIKRDNAVAGDPGTGACTDEYTDHWWSSGPWTDQFRWGSLTPSNNALSQWGRNYQYIRKATNFIDKIDGVPLTTSQAATYGIKKKQYKQEARFFRAYMYFDLFRQFGAVPLIKNLQDFNNVSSTMVSRTPVDSVVNYICNELDTAAAGLPDYFSDTQNYGRISKAACLALKSRVLLYAASPLFNGNTAYANIKNSDGTQLFPQVYDKEKWKKAADAAREAIKVCERAGLTMYNPYPDNPQYSYEKGFYNNSTNSEIILPCINSFGIYEQVSMNSHAGDKQGWGRYSIMQNQVDAYEMKNGHLPFKMDDEGCIIYDANGQPSIDPSSGYKETGFSHVDSLWDGTTWQPCTLVYEDLSKNVIKDMGNYDLYNMYVNRDPRFYASITFQGAKFRNETDKNTRCYHFAFWKTGDTGPYAKLWIDGYPNDNTNNETGYGVRKFLDPTADIVDWIGVYSNFPLFRLGELYLNLAEALNEYLDTPDQEVYDAINKTRARVNIPLCPVSGTEDNTQIGMRKRIRNERRVELFGEGFRFWDVRRWLIGEKVLGMPDYKMNSRPTDAEIEAAYAALNTNETNSFWKYREAGLSIYYKRTVELNCVFPKKMYLMPLPQTEIDKDPNLVQNYGW